jgi:hypothetical protein
MEVAPVGRPTEYKPEYCEEIIGFMSNGASQVQFAAHIGVCKDTINEWAKKHEEFTYARKIAMTKCEAWWEAAGQQGMRTTGGFNAATWIFNMKARFKWQDRTEVTLNADIKTEDKKDERLQQVLSLLQSEFKK